MPLSSNRTVWTPSQSRRPTDSAPYRKEAAEHGWKRLLAWFRKHDL